MGELLDTPYLLTEYDTVDSTQNIARSLADRLPVLVVAARQTEGRGRMGREWLTAPMAAAITLGFHPAWPGEALGLVPLCAGVVARRVLGDQISLKWPNDLLIGELKVGGILSEATGDALYVGMGLNLNWPDHPPSIGAIFDEAPRPETRVDIAKEWAAEMLAVMTGAPDSWPRREYMDASSTIGSEITWEPGGSGIAVQVDDKGALVVETAERLVTLRSGEIHHVRHR